MAFQGRCIEAGSLLGAWPIIPSVVSGAPVLIPRTVRLSATILGIQREPASGFAVDGLSFILNVDGVDKTIGFTYGSPLPLSVVISQINADVGATVAYNDNGFLRLQSPTVGDTSYLKVKSAPTSSDVLMNLGLFAETEASAGDLVPAQHIDPDRQVATPNQMTMSEGESFDAKVVNRAIAQLAFNNDRNEGLLSKKRLAVRNTVDIGSYSMPGAVHGYQMSGGNLVYVGKTSTPSRTQLTSLFAILDSSGRELTKEMYPAVFTGYTGNFYTSTDTTDKQVVSSDAFDAGDSFEKGQYYVASNSFTGGAAVLNGKLLKILEVRSGLGPSSEAVIENIDPATGQFVVITDTGIAFTVFTRLQARVVVDGVFENLAAAVAGTPRLENNQVVKRSLLVPTRMELNNRIVIVGQDFTASPAVQVGDLVTWASSTISSPFSNNGNYRVEKVIDKQTLQVVAEDWSAALLNPATSGGTVGTVTIKNDGAFVLDPFLRFPNDGSNPPPSSGESITIAYLKGTTFRQASDTDPAILGGDLRIAQGSDDSLTQAVLKMWGQSVVSLDTILYGDARINLESVNSRLNTEHYTYDDAEKPGSDAADTRSWGRHKDIRPDVVDMWYWVPPSYSTARAIFRGTGAVDAVSTDEDIVLSVKYNTSFTSALNITGRGHITNRSTPSLRTFVDLQADANNTFTGLGSGFNVGTRYLQRLAHLWSIGSPTGNSLVTQELLTSLTSSTAGTLTETIGQRVTIDLSAASKISSTATRWVHLNGTLTGDGTPTIGNLYGLHLDYTVAAPLTITGDHYGVKVGDITGASGSNYALYTGLGRVRLGDNVGINVPPSPDVGLSASLSLDDIFVVGIEGAAAYVGVGTCDDVVGYISNRSMTGGTVSFSEGMIINDINVVGGTCEEDYGLWIGAITAGTVANYAVYSTNGRAYYNLSPNEEVGDLIAATLDVVMMSSNDADYSAGSFILDGVRSAAGYSGASTYGSVEQLSCFKAEIRGVTNGSVTASAGMWIRDLSTASGGSCTTNYGLYIENQTGGTNNYAIVTQLGKISFNDQVITYVQDSHNSLTQGIGFESTAVENGASPTSGSVGFHFTYGMNMPAPASSFTADAFRITTTNNGRNTGTHSNIRLTDSYTSVSGTHVGLYVDTMTSGSAGNNWGVWVNGNPSYFSALDAGGDATTYYRGIIADLRNTWSSTVAQDIIGLNLAVVSSAYENYDKSGVKCFVDLSHTASAVPYAHGVQAYVRNLSTGNISYARGLSTGVNIAGGTVTGDARGVDISVGTTGGTITTGYGIYIGNVAGSTNYSIYTGSSACRFGGEVYALGAVDAGTSTTSALYINTTTGQLGLNSSSIRVKENVTDMGDTGWLYDLRPVKFNFKATGEPSYGLIAQEVKLLAPDLVYYGPKTPVADGYVAELGDIVEQGADGVTYRRELSGVHYDRFIAILINELQKLKARVDLLTV